MSRTAGVTVHADARAVSDVADQAVSGQLATDLSILGARPVQAMQRWLMHSISWPTLLASAFVALVVTLAVEYLAKPGLEVRKDRILENSQERRKAISSIRKAGFLAGRLMSYKDNDELAALRVDFINPMARELGENIALAFETLPVHEKIIKEWIEAVQTINTIAVMFQFGRPPAIIWERYSTLATRLSDFEALFSTPRWRLWRTDRLIKKIKSSQGSVEEAIERFKEDHSLPD